MRYSRGSVSPLLGVWLAAILSVSPRVAAREPDPGGFLENRGQADPRVVFYGPAGPWTTFFERDGIVVVLEGGERETLPRRSREPGPSPSRPRWAIKILFRSGQTPEAVVGQGTTASRSHFITGRDPRKWHQNVRSFRQVVYREVWPGVDLVFTQDAAGLAYAAARRAGGDLSEVKFRYEGAAVIRPLAGGVALETAAGGVLHLVEGEGEGRIVLGPSLQSVPAENGLRYSSFLGGSRDEAGYAVVQSGDGAIVVAGATRSTQFPATLGGYDPSYSGSFDAFVAKLGADGSSLVWSTFLGDAGDDRAWAIRLDASGRPVVAGITGSANFPTTAGAFDVSANGNYDAFVAALTPDGSTLAWSTFLGGSAEEWDVSGLAILPTGFVAVSGGTRSPDFPTTSGAHDRSLAGLEDAFVAVLESDGSGLRFGTYLGGSDRDMAEDVTVDASGRLVVTGRTFSADLPVTAGAYQTTFSGGASLPDGFVARLSDTGASLDFATYLGGGGADEPYAIALGASGTIVVAGSTTSSDFPTTALAYAPTPPGSEDGFVTALAPDGSSLLGSTYFGGTSLDRILDLAQGTTGSLSFCGWTCSEDLPVAGGPYDATFNGPCDAFVGILRNDLSALLYGTLLGGSDDEIAFALALDASDRPSVVGQTRSGDYPVTVGAYDTSHNSPYAQEDAFVTALAPAPDSCASVTGAQTPLLRVEKSRGAPCAASEPQTQLVDLIQGNLDELTASDIGPVTALACDAMSAVFRVEDTPPRGQGLFFLARYGAGAYTDGDGPELVGDRIPASGDCP